MKTGLSESRCRRAFSLLEVIVATAILAASTVLLLSLFSTGERHSDRAESRVFAQMICQSMLDELIADPLRIRPTDLEPVEGFPDWTCSVELNATEIDRLVRVRVSAARAPKFDESSVFSSGPPKPAFTLVRLIRHQPPPILEHGNVTSTQPTPPTASGIP